jgi:dipeptidyl aminopeptidase/acylaminoacyl peptidase
MLVCVLKNPVRVFYQEKEPGKSALDCVEQAVNYVIAIGLADSNKIGISGHSFGGYETNYIITQTSRFKAAVSGAGITDITSWYFSNSKSLHLPEYWRSETQQWRMGKSFFDDKDLYLRHSPILYADRVTTPLLSWAGKMEVNLPYEQGILFYNALRRAGKKNVLLLYPRDHHVIEIKQNQIDLSKRISNWFDSYLK